MKSKWIALLALSVMATAAVAEGPKNVILMVGDGMGFHQIQAASLYAYGEPKGQPYWDYQVLATTTYADGGGYDPAKAAADVEYVKSGANDSAASATTISTGVKTYRGAIGVGPDGEPVRHLYKDAEAMGKSTGVLSTVYISHATPAAFCAHHEDRGDVDVIGEQMIRETSLDLIMGAGHPWFDGSHNRIGGTGEDPFAGEGSYNRIGGEEVWRDVIAGTAGAGGGKAPWTLVDTLAGFKALKESGAPERVLGIAPVSSTLQASRDGDEEADPYAVPLSSGVPDLALLMEGALNVLGKNPDGFFLMAEGGAIDWAGHANAMGRLIEEQRDFDKAVEAVVAWVEANSSWDDTLLIITADHETGYLLGPDSEEEWKPLENRGKGKVPGHTWHSGSHTNQPVPCIAKGAGAEKLLDAVKGEDPFYGPYIDHVDIPETIRAVWR